MTALQEARKKHTSRFIESLREGDGCLVEADGALNNSARRLVSAMHEDHGEAWLGYVNLHGDARFKDGNADPSKAYWKWDEGLVYNFGADFVAPVFDQVLFDLIRERDLAPYTSVAGDVPRVNAIHERIATIGGVLLAWS
jgi:hypothetical protein